MCRVPTIEFNSLNKTQFKKKIKTILNFKNLRSIKKNYWTLVYTENNQKKKKLINKISKKKHNKSKKRRKKKRRKRSKKAKTSTIKNHLRKAKINTMNQVKKDKLLHLMKKKAPKKSRNIHTKTIIYSQYLLLKVIEIKSIREDFLPQIQIQSQKEAIYKDLINILKVKNHLEIQ